jgi:hypothetical protein
LRSARPLDRRKGGAVPASHEMPAERMTVATGLLIAILAALIAAAIVAVFTRAWRRRERASAEKHPVQVSGELQVGYEWSVAFVGSLPEAARGIEGGQRAPREVYDWLRAHGAVDVGETRLRVRVRGLAQQTVVVRDIKVATERTDAYKGTLVHCPTAGANAATLLAFELDEDTPVGWQWAEDGSRERVGRHPFFERHNVTLRRGEVHDFVIVGCARRYLVRWRLQLELEVGGHRQTVSVDEDGRPFTTCGTPEDGFAASLDWAWYDGDRFLPRPSAD